MTPYHIAKLVEWAGTLRTRKRLQKVVFMLQASGCKSLDADFILHHYGPYSPDVASLADQMVTSGFLREKAEQNQVGVSYSYELSDSAQRALKSLEQGPQKRSLVLPFRPFEKRSRELLRADLRELEYAATIVYFHRQTKDWEEAVSKACEFKKLQPESQSVARALKLAKEVVN